MPRDATALRAWLYADMADRSPDPNGAAFSAAVTALTSSDVPNDLRVALLDVVTTIPGATVAGEPVSVGGFRGTLVSRTTTTGFSQWREVIFDRETGLRYLDRAVLTSASAGMAAGAVLEEQRLTGRELVDSVPSDIVDQTTQPCTPEHWSQGRPSGCDVGLAIPPAAGASPASQSTPGSPPAPHRGS